MLPRKGKRKVLHFNFTLVLKVFGLIAAINIVWLIVKSATVPAKQTWIPLSGPQSGQRIDVLCTTAERQMVWGSYKFRCRDFAKIVDLYFSRYAKIHTLSPTDARSKGPYNATILVKTLGGVGNMSDPFFGRIFVDVVDSFVIHNQTDRVPSHWHVVVQNDLQAEVFKNHSTLIVPHWFNSFESDVFDAPTGHIPTVEKKDVLQVGTVWMDGPPCWSVDGIQFINYTCINEVFDVTTWISKYMPGLDENSTMSIARNSSLGSGYLYRLLFQTFDVLVVYPKGDYYKLRYNSMQRALSQMRSGVPVLLGCNAAAHRALCSMYPCRFNGTPESLHEQLVKMKDVNVRKICQDVGLKITEQYSPVRITQDYLQALGADI